MREFTWELDKDSALSIKYDAVHTKFGDGYEQSVSFGINNERLTWSCTKTDNKATIDAMVSFLRETKGVEAFLLASIPNQPNLKVRLDGGINMQKIGGDTWQASFSLTQVF